MREEGATRVLYLASDLRAFCLARPLGQLTVHSVFHRAVNLLSDQGQLITLASRDREVMPMGMVADVADLDSWALSPGDLVNWDGRLSLVLPHQGGRLTLKEAQVRPVTLPAGEGRAGVPAPALDLIQDQLMKAHSGGIAPLVRWLPESDDLPDRPGNVYCAFIGRDLVAFLKAFKAGDREAALEGAFGLIGFGPGLTPSCDDFLAGVLLSLYACQGPSSFADLLAQEARDRTTLVSYHMLQHAAAGKANTGYLSLIRAAQDGDLEALGEWTAKVLDYGATSGADFLFGFYAAARIGALQGQPSQAGPAQDKTRKIS